LHPLVVDACVLCLRTDRPLTREHVFAHWLVRTVHGGRLLPSGAPARAASASHRPATIARVTAEVCATCNAGWMSTLEVSFRQAVFARPRVGMVWAPDRVTLSRWFTKTAALLAHAHGAGFLTAARRSQLATGVPDDIEVFLARRRRPRQRLDFALDLRPDREDATPRAASVAILDGERHRHERSLLSALVASDRLDRYDADGDRAAKLRCRYRARE